MKKRTNPAAVSDTKVQALLERYNCPVPFHEVRTRFLGNIATPDMSASPIRAVEGLWGGQLPAFVSIDDANELIGALVEGLWSRLTRHQDRNSPFRLMRVETTPTREGLVSLALMRRQELDGFIEGLFGQEEAIDLPERASHGLDDLAQMRAMFAAAHDMAMDQSKTATDEDIEITLNHLREMTKNAEREMHAVLLSCKRARKQMLDTLPGQKPTFH